jgi:hypothetical protein
MSIRFLEWLVQGDFAQTAIGCSRKLQQMPGLLQLLLQ